MTYATIMVYMAMGQPHAGLLRVAAGLARRFDATVIGIAARQPAQAIYNDGIYIAPELIQDERDEIDREIEAAETEFREAFGWRNGGVEWRSIVTMELPGDFVAREARSADLLLTGTLPTGHPRDPQIGPGELVMQAGRPVLVVPPNSSALTFDRVLVAWRDTREARRAISDALPILQQAGHVRVVEIVESTDNADLDDARLRLADVAQWLARHSVTADVVAVPPSGVDGAQLLALVEEDGADLLVAGAYGHSRLREWALGGVTRDLLGRSSGCTLLSH